MSLVHLELPLSPTPDIEFLVSRRRIRQAREAHSPHVGYHDLHRGMYHATMHEMPADRFAVGAGDRQMQSRRSSPGVNREAMVRKESDSADCIVTSERLTVNGERGE